ncbi:MAG: response regulator transcription factor, partial [Calditrichota bacterium]
MIYRCLIIDDEPLARDLLQEYLNAEKDVEVISACATPTEAHRLILKEKPDFILLDIQMPEMTGFELLDQLDKPPAVIFCTAYDEYAIKAFEENAVDYLLKPFDQQRFKKAIAKIREQLSGGEPTSSESLSKLVNAGLQRVDRLLVRKGDYLEIVQVEDIIWIEAMEDYVQLHTEKSKHLLLKRMGDLIR